MIWKVVSHDTHIAWLYLSTTHRRAYYLYTDRALCCTAYRRFWVASPSKRHPKIYIYSIFAAFLSPICLRGRACVYYEIVSIQVECSCSSLAYVTFCLVQLSISSSPPVLKEVRVISFCYILELGCCTFCFLVEIFT